VLIEGIEKINTVVVWNPLQGKEKERGRIRRDLYVIDVDRRNCYSHGGFSYLA